MSHIRAGRRRHQRADVRDQSGGPAIHQLGNLRQAAVQAVVGQGSKLYQLALRQGQWSAQRRVIVVTSRVKGNQRVVGVIAPKKKNTDQRLIARRREPSVPTRSTLQRDEARPDCRPRPARHIG